jgi:hypothetical protein
VCLSEKVVQCLLILSRNLVSIRQLTLNAMDIGRRYGRFGKHRLVCHAIVAVGMIQRHVTLIAPEEMCLFQGSRPLNVTSPTSNEYKLRGVDPPDRATVNSPSFARLLCSPDKFRRCFPRQILGYLSRS